MTENDTALYLLLVIGIMMVMCLNSCILCYLFMPLVDLILLFQVLGNVIMIGVCALVLLSDNKYIEAPVRNTFAGKSLYNHSSKRCQPFIPVPLISFHVLEMLIGIILIVILIKSNSHKKVFLCCRPMNRTITGNDSDIPLHMVISSP